MTDILSGVAHQMEFGIWTTMINCILVGASLPQYDFTVDHSVDSVPLLSLDIANRIRQGDLSLFELSQQSGDNKGKKLKSLVPGLELARDGDGWNALFYSLLCPHQIQLTMFSSLLEIGCNIQNIDKAGNNILHVANFFNASFTIKAYIISLGIDLKRRNNLGYTPLDCVSLEYGCDTKLDVDKDLEQSMSSAALNAVTDNNASGTNSDSYVDKWKMINEGEGEGCVEEKERSFTSISSYSVEDDDPLSMFSEPIGMSNSTRGICLLSKDDAQYAPFVSTESANSQNYKPETNHQPIRVATSPIRLTEKLSSAANNNTSVGGDNNQVACNIYMQIKAPQGRPRNNGRGRPAAR